MNPFISLNALVAILVDGAIRFGVVAETLDRTNRTGTTRAYLVECSNEARVDPEDIDKIPEPPERFLIERPALIRQIDPLCHMTCSDNGLGDLVGSSPQFRWAVAENEYRMRPPAQVDTAAAPAVEDTNVPGAL